MANQEGILDIFWLLVQQGIEPCMGSASLKLAKFVKSFYQGGFKNTALHLKDHLLCCDLLYAMLAMDTSVHLLGGHQLNEVSL